MKHEAAKENLKDVVKALNAVKAYWWIDAGTCLGAIRDHGFIDHDEDIDIGIHGDEVAQELAVALAQKGFEVNHIFGQKGNGYELAMQRDGVKVDFFFYDHIWEGFYKNGTLTKEPSPFAKWCNFFAQDIVEFGCGNGRDLMFFKENANRVVGIDPATPLDGKGIFKQDIFAFVQDHKKISPADVAYCRFLFHAIDERDENMLLEWINSNARMFYAEMRSDKGVAPQDGHERRLINADEFKAKLAMLGMKIIVFQEEKGLAPFGDEDPIVIRVVAQTKSHS
jgi:hypothetical protein